MLELAITNEQKVKVTLHPVTSAGQPAEVDDTPAWEVVAGDVTLDVATDGMSAFIISGTPGQSEVSVTADADVGEGVENIADFIKVTVNGAKATSLGLSADEPVLK